MTGAFNRSIFRNFGALSAIQLANALVPILVFPFALSVLGADQYAELAIAEALSVIVLTAVLYSFEVEGVGKVIDLEAAADRDGLARFFGAVLAARLCLFLISASILLLITTAVTGKFSLLLALWLLVPLGHVFYSYWYFQGTEKNMPVAIMTVAARVTGVALVLIMVRKEGDAWLVPLCLGMPFCAGGVASAVYIAVSRGVQFPQSPIKAMTTLIWNGKTIVLGNAAVVLYRDLNVVLLGATGVPAAGIAAYSLAEKVIKMVQATSRPLNQLYFPRAVRALQGEKRPTRHTAATIAKMTAPQLVGMIVLLTGAVAAYNLGIRLNLLPPHWRLPDVTQVLMLFMLPAVFLGIANYMFGVVGLNYLGARAALAGTIFVTGVLNLIICAMLAAWIGEMGGALAFTLAELMLLAQILLCYHKER
jgi:O-antigen/teichoic acid export membrane protein